MYAIGTIIGALIGTALIGGSVGWLLSRATRLPIELSDAAAIVMVALLAGLTNQTPFSSTYWGTVVFYLTVGAVSYVGLILFRRARNAA